MTRGKTIAVAAAAVLIIGWLISEWRGVTRIIDNMRATCRNWVQNRHQTELEQPVAGFVTDDELRRASLRISSMAYYGGFWNEFEYKAGATVYRCRDGMPGTPVSTRSVELNVAQRALLADALNLVAKLKLETQSDAHPSQPVCDGGEVEYEFTAGAHKGRFKVVNCDPQHLEQFRHKCWQLLESRMTRRSELQVLAIAEPELRARFPETFDAHKPYHAEYSNGLWWVHGTLPKDTCGGTPEARVRDKDGKIVELYHTQ